MTRPVLGRGLAALIPENLRDADEASSPLVIAGIETIQPNPEQPRLRYDALALEMLAESIKEHGVITPLLVRRNEQGTGYILIAGERRLRAAGLAGLEQVPVFVRESCGSKEQLELALIENIQREDLDPIETALSYRRLSDEFGMTQSEIARRVGKERATVTNAIRLLRLPDFALSELRSGTISAGHAKALLGITEPRMMQKALDQVLRRSLNVRLTEKLVADLLDRGPRRRMDSRSPRMKAISDGLSDVLETKVRVEPRVKGDRGRIIIDYDGRADLDRLVHLLKAAQQVAYSD